MMRLTETGPGSVINQVMSGPTTVKPEVGMGATICMWSDRHAATITYVSPSGKMLRARQDHAKRIDKNGMSEMQQWEYSPNPNQPEVTYRLTKKGIWKSGCNRLAIGVRNEYYDFTF